MAKIPGLASIMQNNLKSLANRSTGIIPAKTHPARLIKAHTSEAKVRLPRRPKIPKVRMIE